MATADAALESFEKEMKLQGLWGNVTIVQASEFGRTITSNGDGSDHAWGALLRATFGIGACLCYTTTPEQACASLCQLTQCTWRAGVVFGRFSAEAIVLAALG